jgi:hypothetical protein
MADTQRVALPPLAAELIEWADFLTAKTMPPLPARPCKTVLRESADAITRAAVAAACPQDRAPLTDEQVKDIFKRWREGALYMHVAREVERAHGITEQPSMGHPTGSPLPGDAAAHPDKPTQPGAPSA